MEASEFAVRVARATTGRSGFVGFDRSTHGKSLAAASLGWQNANVNLPDVLRLPSAPDCSEAEILERLGRALAPRTVAAVFVEPILGSGGGYTLSPDYHRSLSHLCKEHGTLLVFDEILTGFYRTGRPFMFQPLGVVPDIVLIGKAMGNGFPVSGVVVRRGLDVVPSMLPGSTFAGNPLASAVVAATLRHMQSLSLESAVDQVAAVIESELAPVRQAGIALRGRGAIWVLEFPSEADARSVSARAMAGGVVASSAGRWLRLLPPATIPLASLRQACSVIRQATD
jgi:acetylornithine/succinyldiaminopimelate/putrescine aminotransferase